MEPHPLAGSSLHTPRGAESELGRFGKQAVCSSRLPSAGEQASAEDTDLEIRVALGHGCTVCLEDWETQVLQ